MRLNQFGRPSSPIFRRRDSYLRAASSGRTSQGAAAHACHPRSVAADIGFTGIVNVDVQNISLLGLRFRSAHPIDANQKAQIRLDTGPLRWSSRVRVVTAKAMAPADSSSVANSLAMR